MWLVRDVVNIPYDDNDEEMKPIDYLNAEVLQPIGQKDCDNIIKAICTLFPQPLMCEWLPPPCLDPTALRSIEKEGKVDDDFVKCSDEVISTIKASLGPKMGFDRVTKITGSDLVELAKSYIGSINKKGSVPSLEQGWMAVIKLKLSEEAKSLISAYEKDMEEAVDGKLPMQERAIETDVNVETLMGLHKIILATKQAALVEKIRQLLHKPNQEEQSAEPAEESEVGLEVIAGFERDIFVEEDGAVKSGALFRFVTQNMKESEAYCEELWDKLFKDHEIQKTATKALNQFNAVICTEVCLEIQLLREEYNTEAKGPARAKVFSSMNEKLDDIETLMKSIPGPPVNLAVVGKAKNAIKLQWDRPEINPDAAKKFIVQYRRGKKDWEKVTVTAEQWHIARKLKSNTRYEFRVASLNDENEQVKKDIEDVIKGLKVGTRLGKLARAALSAIGFLSGTAVAPLLSAAGAPALAFEKKTAKSAAACAAIPFLATLGAPIVGGTVAYHVYQETGDWGDLEERYVHRESAATPAEQGEESSTTE